MTKILVLNAPKNAGKDIGAEYLAKHRNGVDSFSFKKELFRDTCTHYGVTMEWFRSVYDNRDTKEVPLVQLDGKSPREAVIHVSEMVVKPREGDDHYGWELVKSILQIKPDVAVISDGGVTNGGEWVELNPIIKTFGTENIIIVQIHREGCNFQGDSRRYFGKVSGFDDILEATSAPLSNNSPELDHDDPNGSDSEFTLNTLDTRIQVIKLFNNGSIEEFYENLLFIHDYLV